MVNVLRAILKKIDLASEWSSKLASWLILVLVFTLTYDTFARYLFQAPTVWSYEVSYMLCGTIVLMGMACVTLHREHIRVDVVYTHLPQKVKLIIDLFFTIVFFFPLLFVLLERSINRARWSWHIKELSDVSYWYPIIWPFRWMIPVALSLLILAGVAWFIRDLFSLVKGRKL